MGEKTFTDVRYEAKRLLEPMVRTLSHDIRANLMARISVTLNDTEDSVNPYDFLCLSMLMYALGFNVPPPDQDVIHPDDLDSTSDSDGG